jgi:hypothetical protein
MAIETVYECLQQPKQISVSQTVRSIDSAQQCVTKQTTYLDRRLVQVTESRRGLARLLTKHHDLRIDQSECIDHHLAFDTLNRINDNGHRTRIERFEALQARETSERDKREREVSINDDSKL